MKDSCFKMEKTNQRLVMNAGDLTVNEVAAAIKSYLIEIADQENYNVESLESEFFKLIKEIQIPHTRRYESIRI